MNSQTIPLTRICGPGPALPPSTSIPNCLVLGDSVSIGYTGIVTHLLNESCLVQHTPWDLRDGGARDTNFALQCLNQWLINTDLLDVTWKIVHFNFGLHDTNADNSEEYVPLAEYTTNLETLITRLNTTGAKLIYATTTPVPHNGIFNTTFDWVGNVNSYNAAALGVMKQHSIPIDDLFSAVTAVCGVPPYQNCSIQLPNNVHYQLSGYELLAQHVAKSILTVLE